MRPKSLPVTVSPRAGGPGTTVTLRADLRGCTRPGSARGFFNEVHEWDTDGLSRWLVSEHVSGGRWYTGRYRITNDIPAGLGRFAVICDNGRPNFIIGFATFQVQPSTSAVPVRVSPQEAARGTTVKITAEVGRCQRIHIWFYDSKTDGLTEAGGAKLITPYRVTDAGTLTASYTLTRKNAIGPARFRVVCGIDDDHGRFGEGSFRVLGSNATGTKSTTNRNDGSQVPNRIDTGLGGTADDAGPGGFDPTRLLLPAGLLLIIIGAGLGLRQRQVPAMTTDHTGPDRTPARRAVPVLLALGLLLVIGWLLVAIDRQAHQQQAQPVATGRPGRPPSPSPASASGRPSSGSGARRTGPCRHPIPARSAGTGTAPSPATPARRCWSATSTPAPTRTCSTGCATCATATRSWSAGPTAPPPGSWSAAWNNIPRPPCPPAGSGPGQPACCA